MIACDVCTNWLHCKCIGISQAEAETMEDFVCPICQSEGKTAQSLYAPNSGQTQLQRFTSSDAQDDDEVAPSPFPTVAHHFRAIQYGEAPSSPLGVKIKGGSPRLSPHKLGTGSRFRKVC